MGSRTYNIITFGCQMNEHDSETISGMLSRLGYTEVPDRKAADITVINTCSIRENADKRFFGTLGQLKKIKAVNPAQVTCVCGCMMQQEHVVREIKQSYPWVDIIFGTHNIHEFPQMLEELYRAREEEGRTEPLAGENMTPAEYNRAKHEIRSSRNTRVERIYEDSPEIVEGLPVNRKYRHKSFVNIMYGCNNFCTYCIVPYTRGREKSRHPEDILNEVRELACDGVREITLLGQNVNSYRGVSSETGRQWDFPELIYALDRIEGVDRIRFMTSHPKDLSDRLIKAFAECDSLCGYIHLPVQAGSSRVLKRMNRKYTREEYLELVRKLRDAVPGISISTDIIVGFPGESEEDFADTLSLAEEVRFDSAFTFLYSPRKGTPAAEMENQIPETVKHERFNRLVEVMNRCSSEKNAAYVGRVEKVLIEGEGREPGSLKGRTDSFKLVDFRGPADLIGEMVDVEIVDSNTFSLRGELK